MAEEIRVTEAEKTEATIPPDYGAGVPSDPNAARAEIQATRARISETIDEIEEVLLHKKEQIQDRLDVMGQLKQRPMQVLGVAFGAGILLGLLTGGDDEEEHEAHLDEDERAEMWEHRARRLLRIAREQETELEDLRAQAFAPRVALPLEEEVEIEEEEEGDVAEELEDAVERGYGVLQRLQDSVAEQISGYVEGTVRRMIRTSLGMPL